MMIENIDNFEVGRTSYGENDETVCHSLSDKSSFRVRLLRNLQKIKFQGEVET